jgi:hypothetical protein
MSLNEYCVSVLDIPLSEHYAWRGTLVFFQVAGFCINLAALIVHRKRIFCQTKLRKWDLDHVFMTASTLAAATATVTWVHWMETSAANSRAQAAKVAKDSELFAREKWQAWTFNAVYLFFKPVSIGLCVLLPDLFNVGACAAFLAFIRVQIQRQPGRAPQLVLRSNQIAVVVCPVLKYVCIHFASHETTVATSIAAAGHGQHW